tara:strand:+ start:10312 stop:12609 length:2298 start_codon:yes stop_codon:yes gene_type:complete
MATQTQINAIVALYAGYFDRAPDPVGLQFWIDQIDNGRDFNTIAEDFASSSEATALYPYLTTPAVSSPTAFITAVYANLFNRAPDAEGLAFWTEVLESGSVSVADMIEAIINGARDDSDAGTFDKATLDNKVEVGYYFALETGDIPGFTFDAAAKAASIAVLDGVTNDEASVVAAKAEVDAYVDGGVAGENLILTTASDNIVGTDANDTINGLVADDDEGANGVNTFGPGDVINGGAGTDTLRLTQLDNNDNFGDGFGAGATVMNVEILEIVGAGETSADFDLGGFSGLQQIVADYDYDTSYEFYNLQEELVSVTFDASRNSSTERDGSFYLYDIDNSLYTGDDDTLTINVINAGSEEEGSSFYFSHSNEDGDDVFENYNVVVGGDDNYLWIENDSGPSGSEEVKSIVASNVTGNAGSIFIELDEQAALETVDASAMSGDFSFEFNSDVTVGQEITATGGAGNDMFQLDFGLDGDYTLDGGEGRDIIGVDADDAVDLDDVDFSNFEVLALTGGAGAAVTIDSDGFEEVQLTTNIINALTLENLAGGTLTIESNQTGAIVVESTTATDDMLDVMIADGSVTLSGGLDLTDMETVSFASEDASADLSIITSSLNVTGVDMLSFSGAGDVDINVDSIGEDDVATVDLSGLTGQFDNDGFTFFGADTDVMIGNIGDNSILELSTTAGSNVLEFGVDLDNDIQIDEFDAGAGINADVLDFSALGVSGTSELTFTDTGLDVEITSDAFDGTITLTGIADVSDLTGNNFIFA